MPAEASLTMPDAGGIELSDAQFRAIADFMYRNAGIRLTSGKEGLVRSRLTKRIRMLRLADFDAYLKYVERDETERSHMTDALTTNKTSFFREAAHFDLLRDRLVPAWRATAAPIRIWSAGCSSGEEPYTLAMVLADALPGAAKRVRILATDLSTVVLERAKRASYAASQLHDIPPALARRYCAPAGAGFEIAPELRAMIRFARLNLMAEWPMAGPFDAIFCRNVMIYFDPATQERLVARYHALLAPGGHLFVGHSESLGGFQHDYSYVQPAVYVR